jgi:hypothetical protein
MNNNACETARDANKFGKNLQGGRGVDMKLPEKLGLRDERRKDAAEAADGAGGTKQKKS